MLIEPSWQLFQELDDDRALVERVIALHAALRNEILAGDPMLNPKLPIEVRALRRIDDWRALLLLTPWMLARLFFPLRVPAIELPTGWSAAEQQGAAYQVLGPRMCFDLLGQPQQAHLGYLQGLGHYLLQPICLNLEPYPDADAVFAAWADVIRVRDEHMEAARRDCPLQREISRRELFKRLRPGDD
ncbi:[NiFe]-hydrogenase assembly chaperone HybE [Caldichromatium japonicum]|uniref:[NiFe]-hydrogenase assembly chaperone HybE n=1 Tax=Caldichromatium japonicum TaxID=2699430 RepID=A0A6G7VDX5_9GAMM|nr:[NiFe]-hydrogenase assembly chaperone HybE [Caldichromatium japonicum]QIK38221.1 [NiFe]-hydrogenase assembly chaperone HybE [Caldichromatium japonicum]